MLCNTSPVLTSLSPAKDHSLKIATLSIYILLIANDTEKRKITKNYKLVQIPQNFKLLEALILLLNTSCNSWI